MPTENRYIVNSKDIETLIKRDRVILEIWEKYGNPPNWQNIPGFISLSKIILGQQVSLASAAAHFEKLKNFVGEFTPENLLKLTDKEMKDCYISRQKASYLRNLSTAVLEKQLIFEELPNKSEKAVREKLTAIKGIGNWTADVYLLFCLQSKDIFPTGDIAVINTMKELYKVEGKEEILDLADIWRPLKSLGTFFMWHYYLSKRGKSKIY